MDPAETITKVTAAILVEGGKVLIARRNREDRRAGRWEFPGGKIEAGESASECLQRELKEEFNIEVDVLEFIGSSIHHYPDMSIELMAYRVRWTGGILTLNEHAEHRWVDITELAWFDFAPADLPFVQKLVDAEIELTNATNRL